MKFSQEARKIESSAPIEEITVKIAANAKAFNLLFKTIYPDIKKAIVRELITNAWDAQKAADNLNKLPIEVHLPSTFEPWFSVRDYGVSMTHDQIEEIFSTMFESTKDDSDDFAGMYGIGSKTPLGYTDTFSIQCWLDGRTRIYDVFVAANGAPKIALQYEDESDQPTGTLVQLGVKEIDFSSFHQNVSLMTRGFPSRISIDGKEVEEDFDVTMRGNGWVLANDIEGAYIRMGCVLYKIHSEFIHSDIYFWDLPLILDFPIGTFKITGSREDIIYDNQSIALLEEKRKEIGKEYATLLTEKIKRIKHWNEVEEFLTNERHNHSMLYGVINDDHLIWKGKAFRKYAYAKTKFPEEMKFDSIRVAHNYRSNAARKYNILRSNLKTSFYDRNSFQKGIRRTQVDLVIIVDGDLKKVDSRLQNYFIQHNDKIQIRNKVIVTSETKISNFNLKKLQVVLNPKEVVFLKDIEPLGRAKRNPITPSVSNDKLFLHTLTLGYGDLLRSNGKVEVNLNEPVYFLLTAGNRHIHEKVGKIRIFADENVKNTIYQIPEYQYKGFLRKFPKVKFINVYDLYMDYVTKLEISEDKIFQYALTNSRASRFYNYPHLQTLFFEYLNVKLDASLNLSVFESQKMYDTPSTLQKYEEYAEEINKKFEEFMQKYPLLLHIKSDSLMDMGADASANLDLLREYIKLVG